MDVEIYKICFITDRFSGFLVQFISAPTISAFISAATFIIGSGQIKPLLGITSKSSSDFISVWISIIKHVDEIKWQETLLGLSSLALLLAMKNLSTIKKWPKFFKFMATSRNAVIVVIGIVVAYIFYINGMEPFRLTGDIKKGLPPVGLPPFSTEINGTVYNFNDMVSI